jgi:hypothetical protein
VTEGHVVPQDESFAAFNETCGDEKQQVTEILRGKIHIVDLAASDRVSSSRVGESLAEVQHINLSLLALGEVLKRLAMNSTINNKKLQSQTNESPTHSPLRSPSSTRDKSEISCWNENLFEESNSMSVKNNLHQNKITNFSSLSISDINGFGNSPNNKLFHIPYLDSKLTYLLKDSLGGNTKTVMIATICPNREFYKQTLSTLTYAFKASKVRNRANPNSSKVFEFTAGVEPDFGEDVIITPNGYYNYYIINII